MSQRALREIFERLEALERGSNEGSCSHCPHCQRRAENDRPTRGGREEVRRESRNEERRPRNGAVGLSEERLLAVISEALDEEIAEVVAREIDRRLGARGREESRSARPERDERPTRDSRRAEGRSERGWGGRDRMGDRTGDPMGDPEGDDEGDPRGDPGERDSRRN